MRYRCRVLEDRALLKGKTVKWQRLGLGSIKLSQQPPRCRREIMMKTMIMKTIKSSPTSLDKSKTKLLIIVNKVVSMPF